ncbi:MAG: hypothetical protein V2A76_12820 [Planctomycetota bacterium]
MKIRSLFALCSLSALLVALSASAQAQPAITHYLPGGVKPGEQVRIKGTEFPDQKDKGVVYGQGAASLGKVPTVSKWSVDTITVTLPANMPVGTFWLGVANPNGNVKFRGPQSLVVTALKPSPSDKMKDKGKEGTVLGKAAQPPNADMLKKVQLLPDLAITGFSGNPVATIGDTITLRAVIQNQTAGTSALPFYLFHYGKGGQVVRSAAFKMPAKGGLIQVPTQVYIDPVNVSGKGPLLFKELFWVGTSQDVKPDQYQDVNVSNNKREATLLAKMP